MKKLILITIAVVGISFLVVALKFRSGSDSPNQDNPPQQNQNEQAGNPDETSGEPRNLVVSEEELAKLKLQGLVSADEKYYIKSGLFPKIISLETGDGYVFRPNQSVIKVSKLTWSGDGRTLAYLYQVSDPDYLNMDILNTARTIEAVNGDYPYANRVLAAAAKLDYAWLDGDRILFYELHNYDSGKKFYRNGSINIYNIRSELFENPLRSDVSLENIYSMSLSPANGKFLYVQAKLNDSGATAGQQYIVATLDGTTISTSDAFNSNWYK